MEDRKALLDTLQSELDRRQFTLKTVLAVLSGVTISITGCGGDDSPTAPGGGGGGTGGATASVSANHGHTATLSAAQLSAGTDVVLDIRGSANHPHTVALSGPEVVSIANRQRVSKTSSSEDGHNHTVTFN
jgi:hypothetical protein